MLKIQPENPIIARLKKILLSGLNYLENNNRDNFDNNGEKSFAENLIKTFHPQSLTIFDVGANMGDYSKLLLTLLQKHSTPHKIHLFEPLPVCYEHLKKTFIGNPVVFLNNFACSEEITSKEIFYNDDNTKLASLYKRELNHLYPNKKINIELKRLDEYIKKANISHINLLKLDVEGHELFALKGLGEFLNHNFIDAIQFEYGGTYLDSNTKLLDIYNILEDKEYILHKIKPHFIEPRKYQIFMENFALSNYVAISKNLLIK